MQINKNELEKALAVVKPGLASKEIIEQTTSFAFMGDTIVTYNDEISMSYPIKELDIEGAIKAEELFQFLKKVKKEEIDLELKGEEIIFKSGRVRAGFTLKSEITLPLKQIGKKGKWKDIPDDFCHYLSLAMGAAGTDMSFPLLTAINVTQEGEMVASDNYKVMICETGQELPVETFLIPASSAAEVVKFNPTKIAESSGWIHFRNKDKATLSCRIFEDTYPDAYKRLEVVGLELTFPKSISDVLERASIFSKRGHILDEAVAISIGGNRMKVRAQSDTGWIEEEVNFKYKEDPIEFLITPYLLQDILKETPSFVLGERALKFEGAGWTYMTQLRGV